MIDPLWILAAGMLVVVGGILWLRLHAFLALLLGALTVGVLTPRSALEAHAVSKGRTEQQAKADAGASVGTRIAKEFGGTVTNIGILIAMAAIIGKHTAPIDLSHADWEGMLAINLSGTFWCAQEAARRMIPLGRGKIINFSSLAGLRYRRNSGLVPYSVSKAGVVMLTSALAAEWGPLGLHVNCIAPGAHATDMGRELHGSPEASQAYRDKAIQFTPLRRVAEAKDIVLGFIIVEARDLAEATELSKDCPMALGGGSVEVRPVMAAPM